MADSRHEIDAGLARAQMDKEPRRLIRICFNVKVPVWFLKKALDQFPADTQVVACGMEDLIRGVSTLILWSEQFEITPEHIALPEIILEGNSTTGEVKLKRWVYPPRKPITKEDLLPKPGDPEGYFEDVKYNLETNLS